jgi:hypothetical protein
LPISGKSGKIFIQEMTGRFSACHFRILASYSTGRKE